ncbi:calpain-A [Trichonephila clavipes]|nr:calpain-A [Trichonephila clavipes]
MVWGDIGYTSRLPLVRIDGILSRARYISGVLRPVSLPYIRDLRALRFSRIIHDRMLPQGASIAIVEDINYSAARDSSTLTNASDDDRLFLDNDFPPSEVTLYHSTNRMRDPQIVWLRPHYYLDLRYPDLSEFGVKPLPNLVDSSSPPPSQHQNSGGIIATA